MTLNEKISQMLCFAHHGTTYDDHLKTLIEKYKIGSIIHFAHNIENINQIKKLNQDMQEHSKYPLFISLDQEGGMVRRVINDITYLPGAMALSSTNENIYQISKTTGENLKYLGFNVNYAPDADINNNPLNPVINSRSFSDNPTIVLNKVEEAFKGFQDALILPTAKHFPGHGDTNVDSHTGLPEVKKTMEELKKGELIPFVNAINKGIDGIMVAHILYSKIDSEYPSTLSYNIITKLLKEKLGYKGLITTDSLTMGAIWQKWSIEDIVLHGINAGNDILVFCGGADLKIQIEIIKTFRKLVKTGKISMERINESYNKIMKLKAKYCSQNIKKLQNDSILSTELTKKSITKVLDNNLLPLKKEDKVLVITPKIRIATLVDNNNDNITLKTYMDVDELIIESDKKYENIVQLSANYDKIIMATYNVKAEDYQVEIFNQLDKNKTIVIALRSPYDIYHLKDVKEYICTYDYTKESILALIECLKSNSFDGKLPIKL